VSENLDLVRSIYADWERGDFSSADWAHPEIEWVIADGPTAGSWTGVTAMVESFRGGISPWENFRVTATKYRELDDGRVLVLFQRSGRGKTSGLQLAEMRTESAGLFDLRNGKVTRAAFYYDPDALADLGLTE
jgi:ketosteroid isomerase-like protein